MGLDTVPMGIATGVAGSLMGNPVVNVVPANSQLVIPVGTYFQITVGANVSVQVFDGSTWQALVAVATPGFIYSDGVNVRWNNAAGSNQNVTTIKIG